MGEIMLNTISQINERMWYRAIKIIYILGLLIVTLLILFVIWAGNMPPNNYLTKGEIIEKLSELTPTTNANKILRKYEIALPKGLILDRHPEIEDNLIALLESKYYIYEKINDVSSYIKIGKTVKSIYPEYKNISDEELGRGIYEKYFAERAINYGGWLGALKYSLLALLIIYFTNEIVRRLFYYIILGKIFPPR